MVSHGLDREILLQYQAQEKNFERGDIIFQEESLPRYFFQLIEGCIKMVSHGEDDKSFTQGIFTTGQCFGEPPLILNLPYPSSAIAVTSGKYIRLSKENFEKMLVEQPHVCKMVNTLLAAKTYEKSKRNTMLTGQAPEYRIQFILDEMKRKQGIDHATREQICLTRQEIADFTGLRVETVIRTLKRMEQENKIEIRNRKLYY
ncbi:MAG: Crp/Fnr family transcriptional regulator [Saprospiraceae bacterium]